LWGGTAVYDEYEIWAADYSRDGEINVMDIVQMVYEIMSN
tara:strand:- start:243 stop:362 length:120 start_codon:yes stop_codon:yes gene_type:complete